MNDRYSEEELRALYEELKAKLEAEFGREGVVVLWTAQNLTRMRWSEGAFKEEISAASMLRQGFGLYMLPPWNPIINYRDRPEAGRGPNGDDFHSRFNEFTSAFTIGREFTLSTAYVADEGGTVAFLGFRGWK